MSASYWDFVPGFGFATCDNSEEVHAKSEALNRAISQQQDLERQLAESKELVKELKAALKSSNSTVATSHNDDADVIAYKNRIIELETRLEQRAKADKHQIISLQVRLDQTIAAKAAAEKALRVAEAANAQLRAELGRKPSTPSTTSSASSSSSSSAAAAAAAAAAAGGGGGGALSPLPRPNLASPNDTRGRTASVDSLEDHLVTSPDQTPRTPASSTTSHAHLGSVEERDLDTVRKINAFLKNLADDAQFQAKLKEETVQLAFAFWSGADTTHIDSARADEIKQCEVVRSIYPILDELETICLSSNVKIPLDHVSSGKSHMDDETLTLTFGAAFCESNGLLQSSGHHCTPKGGWLFNY